MAPVAKKAPVSEGPNFLDLAFYTGGRSLPEGNYALEFAGQLYQPTKQDGTLVGQVRLVVMLTAHPINEAGEPQGEAFDYPISMGSKAHLSWAPDPDTGKSFKPVPGGPSLGPNNKTNWFAFLKSLYDTGMPQGVGSDLSALDGVWVHIQNVPEPEERKSFKAATGEAEDDAIRGNGLMPIVTEILEGGKPWDGTGGIPEVVEEKPKGKAPVKPAVNKVTQMPAKKAAAAPAKKAAAAEDETRDVAQAAATDILSDNEAGLPRLKFRLAIFKKVKAEQGDEVAQAVVDTILDDDDALNNVLEELGFTLNGKNIEPAA